MADNVLLPIAGNINAMFRTIYNVAGTYHTPVHLEDVDQRATLLAQIADTQPATAVKRIASSAASVNSSLLLTGARQLLGVHGLNTVQYPVWLKFYNKATAPSVGTDVPFLALVLAADRPFEFNFPRGVAFPLGLGMALTLSAADAASDAVLAGDILGLHVEYR